jgi:hypothetical protein
MDVRERAGASEGTARPEPDRVVGKDFAQPSGAGGEIHRAPGEGRTEPLRGAGDRDRGHLAASEQPGDIRRPARAAVVERPRGGLPEADLRESVRERLSELQSKRPQQT